MSGVEILTFGCRLNAHESDLMHEAAAAAGLQDAVIVNSCAVTAEAERQARQAIKAARAKGGSRPILVTGCASHIAPEAWRALPGVKAVIPNREKTKVESFRAFAPQSEAMPAPSRMPTTASAVSAVQAEALPPPRRARAMVEVQNGCDHRCTFCIIPLGRGPSRSVPMAEVIDAVRAHVDEGYAEIVMTGVDLTSYGQDLPERPRLGSLVKAVLGAVPSLPRLRLSSLDPAEMDDDLWDAWTNEPRLMPHLHFSMQAGDDLILKRMKRRHDRAQFLEVCARALAARPGATLGADVIAGFPTESEAMFENTLAAVRAARLTWLHVFPFSARPETPAARMPPLRGPVIRARAARLRAAGDEAVAEHHARRIGQVLPGLIEGGGRARLEDYTEIQVGADAPHGKVVPVRCDKVMNGRLYGSLA